MDRPKFKILRSPSLKRKQRTAPIAERVKLERVLGLTIASNASLSVDRNTGTIAYPAGCVVVLYNPKKGKQTHIFNASKKTLTCLAFSGDGKLLVTGESGHQPAVRVWSLEDNTQVAEFLGHKFGIGCVTFSPNLKYIVSIGTQHDMNVIVWNWKTNIKVASNKVAPKVTDVAFSEDGSMFVTVGNRHVKFWYLDASKSKIKTETLPLQGRNGILGEHQNNFFRAVCCGKGQLSNSVYAVTESGLLCEFDQKRLLVKWVSLMSDHAYAVCLGEQHIFVGCAGGLVRVFSAKALSFLATLPHPHHLGVDVSVGLPQSVTSPGNSRFPDTIAVQCDDVSNRLTCVYNDHSLYVWDVTDVQKVAKTRSFLFHSGAIWGVDVYPNVGDFSNVLPPGSFVTCSSDNTIRIWNCGPNMFSDPPYKRNTYCNELLKILYVDPELNNLLDIAYNPAGKTDKTDTNYQEKIGIRSVRFSPDGKHLASGDRAGNIRVHDLSTMQQIASVEAHDSEVLCLEYTQPATGVNLLATASRDRLLHVFDVEHTYGLVQTLDDHSSAITAIKFVQLDEQLLMLSCGADKSLLFRNAQMDPEFRFVLNRHLVSRTTLYDMEIDSTGKFIATACQDRNIRIYNTRTGKQKKCYSGSPGTEGTLLRVELDPSGHYATTSCSDKNLSIYDFFAGELVASMFGHSEISPGIKFLNDLKHVVSVSVDGCIFIWRLPSEFTECMVGRIGEESTAQQNNNPDVRRETFLVPNEFPDANRNFPSSPFTNNQSSPASSDSGGHIYRFSVGQLPTWAKSHVQPGTHERPSPPTNVPSNIALPKGKWARDVDTDPATSKPFFNLLNEENRMFDLPPSLSVQVKVPIIDDDELNRDEEAEDEFSPNKTHPIFSNPLRVVPKVERQVSDNSSNSVEDEDEGETNEMLCYMPSANFDSDSTSADSTFLVQENDIRNFKESLGDERNDTISAGEEEDIEPPKSLLGTPTESRRESDFVSPDEEKLARDNFERLYQCNETFADTLKRLEDEVTVHFDSQTHLHDISRHSISSRFFDKSQTSFAPGHQQPPVQPVPSMPVEFSVKFADEGKRNLNEVRDLKFKDSGSTASAGGTRRYGRSFGGEPKSTKQETKGETVSYATLPKIKGKASRQSTDSAVVSSASGLQRPLQSGSSQNLPCESDSSLSSLSSQPKRRSGVRVQSYRMQTESSIAKLGAAESSQSRAASSSRRSAPLPQNSKYQSVPNLSDAGETVAENDPGTANDIKSVNDRIFTITKARQFSPVLEVDNETKSKHFPSSSSDSSHFSSSLLSTSAPSGTFDSNTNVDPMPPPSTADVPTSMHGVFLMKAAKHRRHGAPEISLSRAKNVILEKEQTQVESDLDADIAETENRDVSSLDLPVRDSDYPRSQSDVKSPVTTSKSVVTLGRMTVASVPKSASATQMSADNREEMSETVSSPKIVKISQAVSPLRPYSADPSDDRTWFAHQRVLPVDPSSATKEATRSRSTSLDTTTLLIFRPETVEISMTTNYTAGETKVVSSRAGSAGTQSSRSSSYSQVKPGETALGTSSPFKTLVSSPEVDSKSTWVKKAQHMQLQWEHRHQEKGTRGFDVTAAETEHQDAELRTKEHSERTSDVSSSEKNSFEISDVDVSKKQRGLTIRAEQHGPQPTMHSSSLGSRSVSSNADVPAALMTTPRPSLESIETASVDRKRESVSVPASVSSSVTLESSSEQQRHQQRLINLSSRDHDIPKEGEPDSNGRYDSRHSPGSEISNISSDGIKDVATSSCQMLDLRDDTEKQCEKVASELTEAVTKARQMFTQLSSDSSFDHTTNGHDRALKLLRETICEAKDQLTKAIDTAPTVSANAQNLVTDDRMFEMLECYSQKLYNLFKKKLESESAE